MKTKYNHLRSKRGDIMESYSSRKKKWMMLIFLLFIISFAFNVSAISSFGGSSSATYTTSSYTGTSFQSFYGSEMYTYWPILGDRDTCEARQDMLLQVVPAGCQPVVVRSDIIAEQNVPVFCQIQALKLNPYVEIKDIRSITFSGVRGYPQEVVGTGFHPARAALRTNDRLIGSPLANNIGYAVIILKKQPNETALPEFINMTLAARIEYDTSNSLGIGNTEFSLSPVSEQEWATEKLKQSFWQGRYSVRLEEAYDDFGIVSIYSGNKKIVTTRVDKGKVSSDIYLPGMYCRAGLQIHYDGFRSADKKARIEVTSDSGTDVFDVYGPSSGQSAGSSFLNGCRVNSIDINNDGTGSTTIMCASQKITLRMGSTSITETIIPKSAIVISSNNGGTEIYAVYLDDSVVGAGNAGNYSIQKKGSGEWQLYYQKTSASSQVNKESELKDEKNKWMVTLKNELIARRQGKTTADMTERVYSGDTEKVVNDALDSYKGVVDDYTSEKTGVNAGDEYYGVKAIDAAISLAEYAQKQRTQVMLYDKFLEKYPLHPEINGKISGKERLLSYDASKSSDVVKINNQWVSIKLIELSKPKSEEVSAVVAFAGSELNLKLDESREVSLGGASGMANVTLVETPTVNSAKVKVSCSSASGKRETRTESVSLNRETLFCGKQLTLKDTTVPKVATVRLTSTTRSLGSETNITIGIGIEKRAIQLTPDEALSKASKLNKSIEQWEKISEALGKMVTGLKATCFATSGILTVKTFLTGMSGEGIARQQVMKGRGGWNEKCQGIIAQNPGMTLSQCFSENADAINRDVKALAQGYTLTNDKLKEIEAKDTISSGFGGSKIVNRSAAAKDLIKELRSSYGSQTIKLTSGETTVNSLIDEGSYDRNEVSYEQLRDMYSSLSVQSGTTGLATDSGKTIVSEKLKTIGVDVKSRLDDNTLRNGILGSSTLKGTGLAKSDIDAFAPKNSIEGYYDGAVLSSADAAKLGVTVDKDTPAKIITYNHQPYLLTLSSQGSSASKYGITGIYAMDKETYKVGDKLDMKTNSEAQAITQRVSVFNKLDAKSYNNYYQDPEVRYYESEPYKGLPAIVPVDTQKGWYVATKQSLGVLGSSGLQSFKANGRVASFWVCNVGENHIAEFFTGLGDDVCTEFNLDSGQTLRKFPGLSDAEAQRVVQDSISALNEASDKYTSGIRSVMIRGKMYKVGNPASNIATSQCQDFMDPNDCKILFNVCDPVICPASRCDFGGKYPVQDVIQTGIVGSALLCLPNVKEVAIPVCLTGIQAGIDSLVSVMKSYRDCLQENANTGKTVGICDEIHSIYMCEFFWKQAAPLANVLLPKLIEGAYSGGLQGTRGGGEYLTVQGAWDNAKKSLDFFTQNYAVNAITAFNVRSTEEAGTEFCKTYISLKGPKSIKSLLEPDSPPQFYAKFDAIKYSTATVPPTSQYKVYYHIFGGKDSGVYYNIYLKNPPATSYYYSTPTIQVASGFIQRGGYASQTRDFTAPEGYKELCVRINDNEQCGFNSVTSDFGLNQLSDKYAQRQMTDKGVTTEKGCISGNPNALALINLNVQAGVESVIDPQIYNNGIVRICSTKNPGSSTDNTRFVAVGYCDDPRVICWLDKNSVSNAISQSNIGVKNATLQELENMTIANIGASGELYTIAVAESVITALKAKYAALILTKSNVANATALLDEITTESQKIYLNSQKADIALLKARVKDKIARAYLDEILSAERGVSVTVKPADTDTIGTTTYTYYLDSSSVIYGSISVNPINLDGNKINLAISKPSTLFVIKKDNTLARAGTIGSDGKITIIPNLDSILTQGLVDSTTAEHANRLNGATLADLEGEGWLVSGSSSTTLTSSSSSSSTTTYKTLGFDSNTVVYRADLKIGSASNILGYESCTAIFNGDNIGISKKKTDSDDAWSFYTMSNGNWVITEDIISSDIQGLKDDLIVACNEKKSTMTVTSGPVLT
jgi:hypothetical protein